jgi:hypothetical protein
VTEPRGPSSPAASSRASITASDSDPAPASLKARAITDTQRASASFQVSHAPSAAISDVAS